jgi:hypothetical protein
MQQVITTAKTAAEHANYVLSRGSGSFQSKEMRDSVAKIISDLGHGVSKASSRSQQMHPEYITDYVGMYHTGFGNQDYMTYFPAIYTITVTH